MAAPGGVLTRARRGGHPRSLAAGSFASFAAILLPVAVFAAGAWQRRWMSEDGFVTLRVVAQIRAGHGPVFNAGERVEASTSPAWTLILAFGDWATPFPLEVLAVILGGLAAVGGLLLACLAARRLWISAAGVPGGRVVPFGALVVVALPPFRDFATAGLETGLSFFWLGSATYLLAGEAVRSSARSAGGRHWWAPAVIGFGLLVRPDLALVAVPMLGALVVLRSSRAAGGQLSVRSAGGAAAAAGLALPVAWQVFRMGYYGALVPNPALAKEGAEAWWAQGWRYLADLSRPYWLALPVSAGVLIFAAGLRASSGAETSERRRRVIALVAPLAGGLAHGLYVVRVGGDFMHGRLLLPSLFAVLVPVMVIVPSRPSQRVLAGVVAIWAAVVALTVAGPPSPYARGSPIFDERAYWVAGSGKAHPIRVGDFSVQINWSMGDMIRRYLADGGSGLALRPDQSSSEISPAVRVSVSRADYYFVPMRPRYPTRVGIENPYIGILGFTAGTDVRVVDVLGLADPFAARLRLKHPRGRPGHEKHLSREWVWAREVVSGTPHFLDGPYFGGAVARQVLVCPPLDRLSRATTDRLTPGRFLRNLVDAVRLHNLRIDPDPVRAKRQLC